MNKKIIIFILFYTILSFQMQAQSVSNKEKIDILESVINTIEKLYPFKDVSAKTVNDLKIKISSGYYDKPFNQNGFANQVTKDLEEFSNDKHLDLIYNPRLAKALLEDTTNSASNYTAEEAKIEVWNNYGFKELSILDGNIGYINLTVFFSPAYAGETADIAMKYFSNCNALIIDLRQNGGGWGDMVDYLLGYFIDNSEPLLLTINESTLDGTLYSEVVPQYVPGPKLTDIPIYILTSNVTASAAEAFTSHLKFYNSNAMIIGGKTKGAENPVAHVAIDENFVLQIPSIKKTYSSNPNVWEGIGINPDIEVEIPDAKRTAHLEALKKLIESTDEKTAIDKYQWAIDGLNASYDNIDAKNIEKYSGNYDNIKIMFKDNKLYYQNNTTRANLLIPISDNYFVVERSDYLRIKFIINDGAMIMKQIFSFGAEREISKNK